MKPVCVRTKAVATQPWSVKASKSEAICGRAVERIVWLQGEKKLEWARKGGRGRRDEMGWDSLERDEEDGKQHRDEHDEQSTTSQEVFITFVFKKLGGWHGV